MRPLYEFTIGVEAFSSQDIILNVCVEIFVGVFKMLELLLSLCFIVGQIFQELLMTRLEISLVMR